MESIEDLIQFPQTVETRGERESQEMVECNALSPTSCDSDSGYESENSPQFAFDDQMEDIRWKQTLSELFPDLI